jgi:hypothetical protein
MAYYHHVCLTYNVTGQQIEWYPAQAEVLRYGAPAAATVTIWKGTITADSAPSIGPSSATVDAVSTTVDAASGYSQANRNRLYLAATTGIAVGRRYLLTGALGQRELVVPVAIASADYVDLEEPLAYDYAAADTLVGLRQSLAIPNAFIQDVSNINIIAALGSLERPNASNSQAPPFRVDWAYTLSGAPLRDLTTFDVERRSAKANLSIADLRELIPDANFYESVVQRGQDFMPQLAAAERDVMIDIRRAGYNPDAIIDPQAYNRIVLQKWMVTIIRGMVLASPELGTFFDLLKGEYTSMFQDLIGTTCRVWIDTGTSGAATIDPPRQLWLRGR